jgi:cobalt/nickel transport protein
MSDFTGTDDKASIAVEEIDPGYMRWVKPLLSLNKETETLLFVFQAALGAGFIFFYIMRKRRKR